MNQTNDAAVQACPADMKRSRTPRIGILAARDLRFAFWEQRLFEKLASDPRFEISAIIVDGREPTPRKSLYARLTNPRLPNAVIRHLTRMIDKAAMTREPDVPAPVFEARLARTPHVTVSPHRSSHVDRFAATDVELIRDLDLDILLRHGFGILKGDILDAARFGIWSFHHGDNTVNRGSPSGFWESANSEPMTGATLQILTEELDGGNVIARCWRTTEPNAERNRRAILDLSVSLIWRELQRLADTGKVSAEVSHLYDGRLYVEPTLPQSLAYLGKRVANSIGGLKHRLDHRLGRRPLM
jgi:folate-dependent phosphoribosylglycinamide formyltransferase PurN